MTPVGRLRVKHQHLHLLSTWIPSAHPCGNSKTMLSAVIIAGREMMLLFPFKRLKASGPYAHRAGGRFHFTTLKWVFRLNEAIYFNKDKSRMPRIKRKCWIRCFHLKTCITNQRRVNRSTFITLKMMVTLKVHFCDWKHYSRKWWLKNPHTSISDTMRNAHSFLIITHQTVLCGPFLSLGWACRELEVIQPAPAGILCLQSRGSVFKRSIQLRENRKLISRHHLFSFGTVDITTSKVYT